MKIIFRLISNLLIPVMICILCNGPGIAADTIKPLPDTVPVDERMKVSGSFTVGISGHSEVFGMVRLSMNGKPYSNAQVLLGGIKLPETGGAGNYTIGNIVPLSHQTLTLTITYPSLTPGKKHTITVEGIVTGPGIRFTNPSKHQFYPFGSDKYRVSWSGTFGSPTFYVNNLTDGNSTVSPCTPKGTSRDVDSSLFQSGKIYKFYFHGRKYLTFKGPAAPGSKFLTEMTATRQSTCMGLIIKKR